MRFSTRLLLLAGLLLPTACGDDDEGPAGPARELARFQLDAGNEPQPFFVTPLHSGSIRQDQEVRVNVPIVTGNCTTAGETSVLVNRGIVTITLFADTGCDETDVAIPTTRTATFSISTLGTATIRVTARGADGNETVVRTYQVVPQPTP